MKNALFLFIVILTLAISSCKKDDNSLAPSKLVGTTWKYTEGNSIALVLKFISESQLSFHTQDEAYGGGVISDDAVGLYKINGTSLTSDIVYGDGRPETIDGIFEGNTLNIQYFNKICALKKQ
jgi:hypothetical protein